MDAQPLSTPWMEGHSSESTAGSSGASTPVQRNQQNTSAASEYPDMEKMQFLAPQEDEKPYSVQESVQVKAESQPPDDVIKSVQDSVQVEGETPQSQPPDDAIENVTTETIAVMFDQELIEASPPEAEVSAVLSTETPDENRSPTNTSHSPSAEQQQVSLQPPAYSQLALNPQPPTYSQSALNSQLPAYSQPALNPQPPAYSQSAPNPQPPAYSQSVPTPQSPPAAQWQQVALPASSHGHATTTVVQRQPHQHHHRHVHTSSTYHSYPNDYLCLSIIATFCFCVCLGIPAILCAIRVKPLYQAGDYEGAKQASVCARFFSVAAIFGWIISVIVIIVLRVVMIQKQD